MNRLRDGDGEGGGADDPLFRRGVELLQRTPATPPAVDDVKARVWRALRQPTTPASGGPRPLILKLAVVAVVALVAGSAGAVIANRLIANGWIGARREAVTVPPAAAPPARPTPSPVQTADLAPEPRAETGDAPAARDEGRPARPPARSAAKRTPSVAPSAAAVARERSEVLDALIALRREHDPARAGTLLGRYLAAHPRGALREEALVLAIEAADARGDRAAAAEVARAYQAEYPAGRFLSFARSH